MTKGITAAEKTKEKQFKEGFCREAKTDTLHMGEGAGGKGHRSLWKKVWWFFKKLNVESAYEQAMQLLDIIGKRIKSMDSNRFCTPVFIAPLFTIAKVEATQASIDR